MIQILKKNNYSFHNNTHKVSEMSEPLLPSCAPSSVSGRMEGSQKLRPASVLKLLHCVILAKAYEGTSKPQC